MQSWDEVEDTFSRVIRGSDKPFHAATFENAKDVLALCRERCPLPSGAGRGYWETLIVDWADFELEVFEDRIEVYAFNTNTQGSFEIWEEPHLPGQQFSNRFLESLPNL